jgi:predicted small metal-binding protein
MYEHRCTNVGAASCKGVFRAETMEALLEMVADHARREHKVRTPTATLMGYVAKMAKKVQ